MNNQIIQQLKEILKSSGWTQEQLARHLGVPHKTLNLWINAKSKPRVANAARITEAYADIVGRLEVDAAHIDEKKSKALSKKITVAEILKNDLVLDTLTLHLTYHTNTIEGSTMTLLDVRDVLTDDDRVLTNKTAREQIEARNHRSALYFLLETLHTEGRDFRWREDLLLDTHLRLMHTLVSDAGMYRRHGARIIGARVVLANYLRIPDRMKQLVGMLNTPSPDLIDHVARTHAEFEQIHPFSDGNGRMGRLIACIQALAENTIPPLVLRERKRAYYKYLEIAQTQDKHDLLSLFFAESVLSADKIIRGRND